MSNAWFERPQAGPSAAKALVGLGMVFCLPSLLVSLLFYLYLPRLQLGAGKLPYATAYEMALMLILIGFVIGFSMIYQYWADVFCKIYRRSQLWATLCLLPIVVFGPLYYHLAVLLVAFKQRQRRAAYWSFLGVIGGCGQWLAIIWGLSGAFGINFQIGFWFSLCGIAAYLAATQALIQLVGGDGFSRRTLAAVWALTLSWFALQAWHCVLTLGAEQRNAAEQLQLAAVHDSDLVRSALNTRSSLDDKAAPINALGEALIGVSDDELYAVQREFSAVALSAEELERVGQWLAENHAVLLRLDALADGPPLSLGLDYDELSLADIRTQELDAWKHLWMAAQIYRMLALRAQHDGDDILLVQTLRRQAWLRDSAGAVPSMSFHHLSMVIERQRLDVIAAALECKQLTAEARGAIKADLVAAVGHHATQQKNALFRDALDMLAAVEYLSLSPLAMRQATNSTGIVAGLTRLGRYMPGFQALGGVLCNPIHWAMQSDLAWYFAKQRELLVALAKDGGEAVTLNVDDTPGYACFSAVMLLESKQMLQIAAELTARRQETIHKLE